MSVPFLFSMTGYARTVGTEAAFSWQWELKSVNGKGLDLRIRLPGGYDRLEIPARERMGKLLKRGNVNATLDVRRSDAKSAGPTINRAALEAFIARQRDLAGLVDQALPRLEDIIGLRGMSDVVEETSETDTGALDAALLRGLDDALAALSETRAGEGRRLGDLLTGHIDAIESLTAQARTAASLQPQAVAEKLRTALAALLDEGQKISEDRLAAEIALLASKADATEELDRLEAHISATRELLAGGGSIGRKLDFLAQEFNREANTLMSKAAEMAVTRLGLELKTVIDQFREQVQNVE
jgi:uncharacterized protein (TIGR00255 family)